MIFYIFHSESVFVGENKGSSLIGDTLYALPAFIDDSTPTIKKNAMNLLEGPNSKLNRDTKTDYKMFHKRQKTNYIIFGHYDNPSIEDVVDTIEKDGNKAMSVRKTNVLYESFDHKQNKVIMGNDNQEEVTVKANNQSKSVKNDEIAETKKNNSTALLKKLFTAFKFWFDNEENKILKLLMVILIGSFIMMVFYFRSTMRELRQSQNGSRTKIPRSSDSTDNYTTVESVNGGEQIVF